MNYNDLDLSEIVQYINAELLKGRSMKDIEEKDFGVNQRVIVKRLSRKNIKKVDGQFVFNNSSNVVTKNESKNLAVINTDLSTDILVNLKDNKEFIELKNKVDFLEKALSKIICVQESAKVVRSSAALKIYSNDGKPVAKTIRLYKEIWDKVDSVKKLFPHINYQTLMNSLIDEITEKYLHDLKD